MDRLCLDKSMCRIQEDVRRSHLGYTLVPSDPLRRPITLSAYTLYQLAHLSSSLACQQYTHPCTYRQDGVTNISLSFSLWLFHPKPLFGMSRGSFAEAMYHRECSCNSSMLSCYSRPCCSPVLIVLCMTMDRMVCEIILCFFILVHILITCDRTNSQQDAAGTCISNHDLCQGCHVLFEFP